MPDVRWKIGLSMPSGTSVDIDGTEDWITGVGGGGDEGRFVRQEKRFTGIRVKVPRRCRICFPRAEFSPTSLAGLFLDFALDAILAGIQILIQHNPVAGMVAVRLHPSRQERFPGNGVVALALNSTQHHDLAYSNSDLDAFVWITQRMCGRWTPSPNALVATMMPDRGRVADRRKEPFLSSAL